MKKFLLSLVIVVAVAATAWALVPHRGAYAAASGTSTIVRQWDPNPSQTRPNYIYVFAHSADVNVVFLPEDANALNDTFTVRAAQPRDFQITGYVTGFKVIRPTATAVDAQWMRR